jgi:hypothetical protein
MWLTILYKYIIIVSYLSYFSVFDFKIKAPTCHTLKLTIILTRILINITLKIFLFSSYHSYQF